MGTCISRHCRPLHNLDDLCPHDLLITNLEAYGAAVFKVLRLEHVYANMVKIRGGVPQGSVLGPLLFNIVMNDIFHMNLDCNISNCADDTTLYSCRSSIDIVITEVENTLTTILTWYDKNRMVANPAELRMMFLGKSRY